MNLELYHTKYDWEYRTVDNGITSQANLGESVYWPRGKMLGGSSAMNGMIYVRGNNDDFQEWYDEGNSEWHPSLVHESFIKAEGMGNLKILNNEITEDLYGRNGPQVINVFNITYRALTKKVLSSLDEIGFKNVIDVSAGSIIGSGLTVATAASGKRQSTATSYLNTVKNRPNLKVIKYSHVNRILINDLNKLAFGVEVERHGTIMKFFADKEIVLSAGSINTPQLLMLSGIGPRKHLESKNIQCVVDLPAVGQNLQDHLIIPVTIYGNEPGEGSYAEKNFEVIEYLYNRTGYLAQFGFSDVLNFYSNEENATRPLFQNHLMIFHKNSTDARNWFGSSYKMPVVNSVVKQNSKFALYVFIFNLLHPCSTGNVSLNTSNPKDKPLIYMNNFEDPSDLEASVEGIKMLTKIVNTSYFKAIGGFLGRMNWPPCDKFELDSKEYWACICTNMVITIFHPVGTAKMGSDTNYSVVNSKLKVHKINGLRVIDASIMPSLTSGNTNAPTIMIGERGSDIIKKDYNK